MKVPLEIAFHNLESSEPVRQRVRNRVDRLERHHRNITSCRVSIEAPHKSSYNTHHYEVHIDLSVPGKEVVVSADPRPEANDHDDVYVAIRDAFDTAERRLNTVAGKRRQRRNAKSRTTPPRAVIARIFPADGYGFLEAPDGHEVYFHQNAVLNRGFDDLKVGVDVQYAEEQGIKGPQASSVRIL